MVGMSRTYKATGINLKGMPLGESDRLLTILTREFGLVRAVAPGARKLKSKLGGRTGLFVVNELLLTKGRSLDKVSQAETLESYSGLSKELIKLTASQYLAELVLCQALSDQPQEELFSLLCEHLTRLERSPQAAVHAYLAQAVFHLLAWAGIAPQVQVCCVTQHPLVPDWRDPDWRVGFSMKAGGVVNLSALESLDTRVPVLAATSSSKSLSLRDGRSHPDLSLRLTASELSLLQELSQPNLLQVGEPLPDVQPNSTSLSSTWLTVERTLRQYVQYQLDRPIRSAALLDSCLTAVA